MFHLKKSEETGKQKKMIEELISTLRAIENDPSIEVYDDCLPEYLDIVQRASELATMCLITNNGHRDYNAELVLGYEGFRVVCVERDRFGWLAAGIETSKGLILYG